MDHRRATRGVVAPPSGEAAGECRLAPRPHRPARRFTGALLVLLSIGLLSPNAARARPQTSLRLITGGGVEQVAGEFEGLFEMGLRSELLFGAGASDQVRLGPALELRTADFDTGEVAGGAHLLLPVISGFPLGLSWLGGVAFAPQRREPITVATVHLGYRSYNYHSIYGYGLAAYVGARVGLGDQGGIEVTAGIEIDLAFLIAIPVAFTWELITAGDPDESD